MKRVIPICLIVFTIILTGCSNDNYDIVCTKNFTDTISKNKIEYTAKVQIDYTDDKIDDSVLILDFNEEITQEEMCDTLKNIYSDIKCSDKEIKINNYYKTLDNKNKIITKTETIKSLKKEGFKCK